MITRQPAVRKFIDQLICRGEESNGTFRLQNNTVYELQSIHFRTTF